MTAFDFSPLFRTAIGFDRLTDALEAARRMDSEGGWPPYDIELTGEDHYRISMAVPGFRPEDLEIEVKDNRLRVAGRRKEAQEEDRKYLYRGISQQAFERVFQLADHVKVTGAEVKDGLLHIELVRELPESMKPRRIEIRTAETQKEGKLIEGQADRVQTGTAQQKEEADAA